ncbi:MAG: Coenzyme F420 hydrogenase/dehydrogenase, beta subunit C-terminal domain [Oscillospiraceae bacterium]|nr:Coenzyme F420 hydrogenase/dehydrogenase, beta subunit C-terminal domain [Oscillospiraceae bacterium]
MIQITKNELCCGCTACANACPKDAIVMAPDAEGFLYPQILADKCVDCGLCEKVCPIGKPKAEKKDVQGYIVRYYDAAIVEHSTSGGVFTALASHVIGQGGAVYGTGYDANMRVVCKKATTVEELAEMRGSKFVQSHLGDTFRRIKRELAEGKKLLFVGTPCQVEGLLSYLRKKPDNLICIDFVCRGVPSPGLWANYVQMMEKKFGSKMVGARFKHKTYGYHATTMKVDFENGKSWYGSGRVDPMMKAFVSELASRPSCGACNFKQLGRKSDITMFDCYEFTSVTGMPDDNKGYSSVLIQSEQGAELFEAVRDRLTVIPAQADQLVKANGIMVYRSAKPNPKREQFYRLAQSEPIDVAMEKTSPITAKDHAIEKVKGVLHKAGLVQLAKKMKKKIKRSL